MGGRGGGGKGGTEGYGDRWGGGRWGEVRGTGDGGQVRGTLLSPSHFPQLTHTHKSWIVKLNFRNTSITNTTLE